MLKQTWTIEDHICRFCGGRILRCEKGTGMSPGGNPLYRCADCGKSCYSMMPDPICWCGLKFKNSNHQSYVCVPFSILKEQPELKDKFYSCGCDPDGPSEVGVLLRKYNE
jgi:hypothetical protein